jgi:hypothetical protein
MKNDLDHARELLTSALEQLEKTSDDPWAIPPQLKRDIRWALVAWDNNYGPVLDSHPPRVGTRLTPIPEAKPTREVQTYSGPPVSVTHSVDWNKPAEPATDKCPFCENGEVVFKLPMTRVEKCLVCKGTGKRIKERV